MEYTDKKNHIVSTMMSEDTYELSEMIRKKHKMKRSELLRTIIECVIIDDLSGDCDYDLKTEPQNTDKPLTHKIQTSLSDDLFNDFIDLMLKHDMTQSKLLRVVVDVLVRDYFIQHLQRT